MVSIIILCSFSLFLRVLFCYRWYSITRIPIVYLEGSKFTVSYKIKNLSIVRVLSFIAWKRALRRSHYPEFDLPHTISEKCSTPPSDSRTNFPDNADTTFDWVVLVPGKLLPYFRARHCAVRKDPEHKRTHQYFLTICNECTYRRIWFVMVLENIFPSVGSQIIHVEQIVENFELNCFFEDAQSLCTWLNVEGTSEAKNKIVTQ